MATTMDYAFDNQTFQNEPVSESDWQVLKNKITPFVQIVTASCQKAVETLLDATQPAKEETNEVPKDIESGFGEQVEEDGTLTERVQSIIYDYATQATAVVTHKIEDISKQVAPTVGNEKSEDRSELQLGGDS
eukprot:TRINITY_DN19288_c0_g1_i1.p1 TRINITY_DN19288_c0_g1~~TRINITY_DN19288_c0_g1_i1.p1  ORF type:complete len:133 (-),score=34.66 TRINITY_DN19288_c0_g1_i1:78-476(-)